LSEFLNMKLLYTKF